MPTKEEKINQIFTPYIHDGGIEAKAFYEFSETSLNTRIIPQIVNIINQQLAKQREEIFEGLKKFNNSIKPDCPEESFMKQGYQACIEDIEAMFQPKGGEDE